MNHSSCVPGLARNVCFGSWVSRIVSVPYPSFSVLGLGSKVPCKTSVLGPGPLVPPLGSQVSGPGSHLCVGSRVPPLGSRVSSCGSHPQDGFRVSDLRPHHKSRVSGPTFWICPPQESKATQFYGKINDFLYFYNSFLCCWYISGCY